MQPIDPRITLKALLLYHCNVDPDEWFDEWWRRRFANRHPSAYERHKWRQRWDGGLWCLTASFDPRSLQEHVQLVLDRYGAAAARAIRVHDDHDSETNHHG